MDLEDELPRIHHKGNWKCVRNPVTVKTIQDVPVPVTTRLDGTRDSAEQAVNTPNDDEERLEQMSHPKNKVMERMTLLERWNGLAWVCTAWLWKGLARWGVFRDHSVPPNTTRSTRQVVSVWV